MTQKKDFLRKSAEAPAELLDYTVTSTIEATHKFATALPENPVVKQTNHYWESLGPGLTS